MDGVLSYFYLSFASEHLFLDISGASERISGRHALRHHSKTTHTTSRSSLCWSLFPTGLHVLGIRDRERFVIFRAASLAALARRLRFFDAFVCLEICSLLTTDALLAKHQEDGSSMVMRAHVAVSPRVTTRTGYDIDDWQFFLCLSLNEYPGGTGSLIRQTLHLFNTGIDINTGGISCRTGCGRLWSETMATSSICDVDAPYGPELWVSER